MTESATDKKKDEQAKLDDPNGESKAQRTTRYRILWAALPSDPDEPLRYREILNPTTEGGWYEATNPATAKRRAFDDERAEAHPHVQRAAEAKDDDDGTGGGVVLRAVPAPSWGEITPERTVVETRRETSWGF